ncbi:cyclin G [Rhodnius prolixus]
MASTSRSEQPDVCSSPDQQNLLFEDIISPSFDKLNEALSLEAKFQPKLQLPVSSQDGHEVTVGIRDGSAHVLRSLKIWYDLPSEVLFVAANLMDRFLTKMKVRPKHMACISIASFQLACVAVCSDSNNVCENSDTTVSVPTAEDILAISQCRCSRGDLFRMQSVIAAKTGVSAAGGRPVTAYVFLQIFHELLARAGTEIYARAINAYELCQRLEVIVCDAACSSLRPSIVSLVLLCCQLDSVVASLRPAPSRQEVTTLVTLIGQLQTHCRISERLFYSCHSIVLDILARYDAESQLPHRQRLIWRLSQRTRRHLRPTQRLVTTLATIDEHRSLSRLGHQRRRRSGDGSSSEEEWAGVNWNSLLWHRRVSHS